MRGNLPGPKGCKDLCSYAAVTIVWVIGSVSGASLHPLPSALSIVAARGPTASHGSTPCQRGSREILRQGPRYRRHFVARQTFGLSSAGAVARVQTVVRRPQGGTYRFARFRSRRACCHMLRRGHQVRRLLLEADKTYADGALGSARPAPTANPRSSRSANCLIFRPADAGRTWEFPREYAQVPPMHSAIKQDGRPLYEYARAGTRERGPRAPS